MEKDSHSQLELFSQGGIPDNIGDQAKRNLFLSYIRAYEKTILLIIGFITVAIIVFSLGVEKGKKTTASFREKEPIAASQAAPSIVVKQPSVMIKQPPAVISQPPAAVGSYTIQVASYLTKPMAQKEAEALRKSGHATQLLAKGKYIVVCVGNFSNQNSAESLLTKLKKRYRDCRIRRL